MQGRWRNDLLPWNDHDLYGGLGSALEASQRAFEDRWKGGRSVRVFAAAMLATLDRVDDRWDLGLDHDEIIALANGLVALNHERNQCTHRRAGAAEHNEHVRALALACVEQIATMRQGST